MAKAIAGIACAERSTGPFATVRRDDLFREIEPRAGGKEVDLG